MTKETKMMKNDKQRDEKGKTHSLLDEHIHTHSHADPTIHSGNHKPARVHTHPPLFHWPPSPPLSLSPPASFASRPPTAPTAALGEVIPLPDPYPAAFPPSPPPSPPPPLPYGFGSAARAPPSPMWGPGVPDHRPSPPQCPDDPARSPCLRRRGKMALGAARGSARPPRELAARPRRGAMARCTHVGLLRTGRRKRRASAQHERERGRARRV